MRMFRVAAALALFALASPVLANITIIDGNRNTIYEKSYTMPDGSQAPASVLTDPVTGVPYSNSDQPPLPTGAAQDGTDAVGVSAPSGAIGIRGWLSSIFNNLGIPGSTVCSTDTGSCNVNALLQRIAQRLTTLIGTNLTVTDSATETNTSTTATNLGAPGASACASDTASCSLNALIQRVAQRITTLIGTNLTVTEATIETNTGSTATGVGAPGSTVCATDTGTCNTNALLQRLSQRLTTLINALTGSPTVMIGNTPNTVALLTTDSATTPTGGLVPAYAEYAGGQARTSEATAATNGNKVGASFDVVGRQITFPYANKENLVSGSNTLIALGTAQLIAAPGANLYLYVTSAQCSNSGSTGVTVTFTNGVGGAVLWQGFAPSSSAGVAMTFPVPLGGPSKMTANTAFTMTSSGSTTTLMCNAQGYIGT